MHADAPGSARSPERLRDDRAMTISPADLIAGMAKGMAVLESFDTQRQRLNATLAAQRAGITRAAARRHLLTLAHLGYLETDGSHFWLSAKVLRFSGSYLASARLPRVVQPALNHLAALTGESFSVVVRDGHEVVIVARSGLPGASGRITAYGLHLGARLPVHATSTGRVLLAALPREAFDTWCDGATLARLTAHTPTRVADLRRDLVQARRQDWFLASESHEIGVHALAVPLRDPQGRTVAALNVVAGAAPPDLDRWRDRLLPRLQDAARDLRGLL
jgi:IclR family pca regulon transcriptional regulator